MDSANSTPLLPALSADEVEMLDQLITHEFRIAPYNTPQRKLTDARLLVAMGYVAPDPTQPGTWQVQGNEDEPYTVTGDRCTCKYARTNPERSYPCDHSVAAVLAAALRTSLQEEQGLTVVQKSSQDAPQSTNVHHDVSRVVEDTALAIEAGGTPSVPGMSLVVPGIESTTDTQAHPPTMPVALQAPLSASALEQSLSEWGKQRDVITKFLLERLVRDVDYGKVHFVSRDKCKDLIAHKPCTVPAHWSKDTLFKPGAEKFTGLFQLTATFHQDKDTWEMLGMPHGVLCYVCNLQTRAGEIVGEGRGARDIKKDGDINKAIKMAQKAAQIDAVLRTGALSDLLTQDLDDIKGEDDQPNVPDMTNRPTHDSPDEAQKDALRKEVQQHIRSTGRDATEVYKWAQGHFGKPIEHFSVEDWTRLRNSVAKPKSSAA